MSSPRARAALDIGQGILDIGHSDFGGENPGGSFQDKNGWSSDRFAFGFPISFVPAVLARQLLGTFKMQQVAVCGLQRD